MAADLVVSTEWLAEHLNDPRLRVVDMRGTVVTTPGRPRRRAGRLSWRARRISGRPHPRRGLRRLDGRHHRPRRSGARPDRARRIDSPRRWRNGASAMIRSWSPSIMPADNSRRGCGGPSATTATTTFACSTAAGIDGSSEGRPVEAGEVAVARAVFTPRPRPGRRVTAEQLAGRLDHPDLDWQLVDARDAGPVHGSQTPRAARRTRPGRDQRPTRALLRARGGLSPARRNPRAHPGTWASRRPADRSLIATAASRPPSFSSTWRGLALPTSPTTTAHGTNGPAGSICPSNLERP